VLQQLKQRGVADKIDVLINNAGCGSRGAFMGSSIESLLDAVDLNVRATVLLTRLLAPRIAKRGSGGRILIMGSVSSVGPGPSVAVYAATKVKLLVNQPYILILAETLTVNIPFYRHLLRHLRRRCGGSFLAMAYL